MCPFFVLLNTGERRYPAVHSTKRLSRKGKNELVVPSFRHSGEGRNPLVFNAFD